MPRDKTGHFYYPRYPTIWQADTAHLTLAQDGAYQRLIDHYMLTRTPLSSSDAAIARVLGVSVMDWLEIKDAIMPFFKVDGPIMRHSFCDDLLNRDAARISKSHKNGILGGRPKHSKQKKITHPDTHIKPLTKQNRIEHNNNPPTPQGGDASSPFEANFYFNEFWLMYPHKTGMGFARAAYQKALAIIDHKSLMTALRKQIDFLSTPAPRYRMAPAKWLEGECWNDVPEIISASKKEYSPCL